MATGAAGPQPHRFEARLGYGLAAFGGRLTATPQLAVAVTDSGTDYTVGWGLVPEDRDLPAFKLGVEATRRERGDAEPEHEIGLELNVRW